MDGVGSYALMDMFFVFLTGEVPMLNVSYKPQKISPKHQGTVRQLLHERIRDSYIHPQFVSDVLKPLQIEPIFDQEVIAWQLMIIKRWELS